MAIRVNYANVFRQVGALQRAAEEHARAASALEAQRNELAARWRDPAGAAYGAAAAQLAAQMRASAAELSRTAAQIRSAALAYQAQEEARAKAAKGLAH